MDTKGPPSFVCVQEVIKAKRIASDDAAAVLGLIQYIFPTSLGQKLFAMRVEGLTIESASAYLWALTFVRWLAGHPDQMAKQLSRLSPEERDVLRRHTRAWWQDPAYDELEPTIRKIYTHHFLAIYPEARTSEGLPDREAFPDDYLWATNWTDANLTATPAQIRTHIGTLAASDRAVLTTLFEDWGDWHPIYGLVIRSAHAVIIRNPP